MSKLILRARELIAEKKFAEAMIFLDATQLSDLRVKQAQELKAQCLRDLGRDAEAARIETENTLLGRNSTAPAGCSAFSEWSPTMESECSWD